MGWRVTLDEICRLCTDAYNAEWRGRPNDHARLLADALVAILPVVRAADSLASLEHAGKMSLGAKAYEAIERGRRTAALYKAVETMRERLAKDAIRGAMEKAEPTEGAER
jgi:hypothetical protein